ncbi:MAG: hypothetical protein ABI594_13510 [Ginsengibacter sp.]
MDYSCGKVGESVLLLQATSGSLPVKSSIILKLANVKDKRINNRIGESKMEYAPQVLLAFVFYKREDILTDLDYEPGPRWMKQ